jgi:hypothetical protein
MGDKLETTSDVCPLPVTVDCITVATVGFLATFEGNPPTVSSPVE